MKINSDKISSDMQFYSVNIIPPILTNIIKNEGIENIEIRANLQTVCGYHVNYFKKDDRYENVMTLCKRQDIIPILSEIYEGAFDIKNMKYWINRYTSIPIIIDDSVENYYNLIVRDGNVLGFYHSADRFVI